MKTLVKQLDEVLEKEANEDVIMANMLWLSAPVDQQVSAGSSCDENEIPF